MDHEVDVDGDKAVGLEKLRAETTTRGRGPAERGQTSHAMHVMQKRVAKLIQEQLGEFPSFALSPWSHG